MSLYHSYSSSNQHDKYNDLYYSFTPIVHTFKFSINKKMFLDNMNIIFNNCDINVYGFNNSTKEYWGKKNNSNNCILHFTLSINDLIDKKNLGVDLECKNDNEMSEITIQFLVGKKYEIQQFLKKLTSITNIVKMI